MKKQQRKKKEIKPIKTVSLFIYCLDCKHTCLNDDDNVCLKCGSKNTKRILNDSPVLKYRIGQKPYFEIKKKDLCKY